MGISGLSSYMQCYVKEALEWHKLKNCHIVIDGNNLAYELYNPVTLKVAFGGEYDKYASYVEAFFRSLVQCNIKITIVMDGGHPSHDRKFETVFSRISRQIDLCQNIKFTHVNNLLLFPLHARSVLVNVAQRMNIDVLQGDFEADEDIAVIAKRLDAYVLSNDSDFYLFGCPYVLLSSLNYKKVQTDKLENGKIEKYVPCYSFSIDKFSKRTKIHKNLISVIAPLLGNDNIDSKKLEFFYTKINRLRPTSRILSERHRVIGSVFRWLSKQNTHDPDQVLNKFLNFIPEFNEDFPDKNVFRQIMLSYKTKYSTLSPWVDGHCENCPANKIEIPEPKISQVTFTNFNEELFLPLHIQRQFMCNCNERNVTDMLHSAELPSWFLKAYRMHLISSDVSDILNKNYLFMLPQIEVSKVKCVNLELKHIVTGIRGLLWKTLFEYFDRKEKGIYKINEENILSKLTYNLDLNDTKQDGEEEVGDVMEKEYESDSDEDVVIEDDDEDNEEFSERPEKIADIGELRLQMNIPSMNWYLRKEDTLWAYCLPEEDIENYKHLPTLLDMDKMSLGERKKLFFVISKLEINFTEQLPKDLEFILFCICFWYVKFKKRVKQSGVLAHLMCTLMFFVIDGKIGRVRPQNSGKNISNASETVKNQLDSGALPDPSKLTILELINSLTKEECTLANLSLSQYHQVSTNEVSKPTKYRKILHTFSAFQSSVYFLQILNSILFFPFPSVVISSFWSGMFCYSMQKRFQKSSFNAVLKLFGCNVRVKCLFIRLYNVIRKEINLPQCFQTPYFMAPEIVQEGDGKVIEVVERKCKRRVRRRKARKPDAPEIDVWEDATEEDLLKMGGNKFSKLFLS